MPDSTGPSDFPWPATKTGREHMHPRRRGSRSHAGMHQRLAGCSTPTSEEVQARGGFASVRVQTLHSQSAASESQKRSRDGLYNYLCHAADATLGCPISSQGHRVRPCTLPACRSGTNVGGDSESIPGGTIRKDTPGFSAILHRRDHDVVTTEHGPPIPTGGSSLRGQRFRAVLFLTSTT